MTETSTNAESISLHDREITLSSPVPIHSSSFFVFFLVCVCAADHVEAFHIDKDAAEESLEHLAEHVAHQPDKTQLQVLGHFLQNPTSIFSHLIHRQARLQRDLRRQKQRGSLHVGGRSLNVKRAPSNLLGYVAQVLRLQHCSVELGRGAGRGVSVGVGAKCPQGEAEVGATPPLLQYVHQLLLVLQACSS